MKKMNRKEMCNKITHLTYEVSLMENELELKELNNEIYSKEKIDKLKNDLLKKANELKMMVIYFKHKIGE
ncbi:MAG: hypothetical protein R3Y60_01765 [bacterium]